MTTPTALMTLSDATRTLVKEARRLVACVGAGMATPRSGLLLGTGEVLTVAAAADIGETVPVHVDGTVYDATVVGFDEPSGLALLRHPEIPGDGCGDARLPGVGELCVTVACPVPSGHESRMGMVRCVGGETRLPGGRRVSAYFQTDATRFRGFSGSVVFAADGAVLGMTMPARRDEEGFALPLEPLLRIAADLREGRHTGTGYLGIRATAVDVPGSRRDSTRGLLVTGVDPDSPAERAGIAVGTFVLAVDNAPTPDLESLYDALIGVRAGQELEVDVQRSGGDVETRRVEVALRP